VSQLRQPRPRFRASAAASLENGHMQLALDAATARLYEARLAAWGLLPDVESLRDRGREIRQTTIADLDRYLDQFTRTLEDRGGHVHFAETAADATAEIAGICRSRGARLVAKSKSMASEEIRLNDALESEGLRVVETDLGEYILQLAGEHPAHIVAPAIEKTAEEVAVLLGTVEGHELQPELEELTAAARRQLREVFTTADVGITGANFAVAETGSIVLVTNEGNGRLVSALPRVHIAILGMERLVPSTRDLAVLLQLLARSATGQRLTTYTTVVTGPRRAGEEDGPEELHVIVLDNGRAQLREGRYREMLNCIRCGACLNVCPVYRKSGGDAYGPVYSGPMGAVLVPLLVGLERAPSLPHASSLCGACTAACPVKIPLHELLLELRRDLVTDRVARLGERLGFRIWALLWSTRLGYRASTALARVAAPLGRWLPGPGRAWASQRALPSLARRRFRDRRP
jgi:L-lactate dehydrogenase complex protein LldF